MMKPMRLAVASRCLNRPLKPAMILASQLGAAGVQIDARNELKPAELTGTGRREFLHFLDDLGLAVAAVDFPTRRGLFVPDQLDERIDGLKQAIEFAAQLKARIVTVRAGALPAADDIPGNSLIQSVLNDLARFGNHAGVTLAIGLPRESGERQAAVMTEVRDGPIGANFDPAAVLLGGQSPVDSLMALRQFVAHVIARDAIFDVGGPGREVPLGRGEVPWDELLALLHEIGYEGWLTVERTQGDDRAGDAGRAVQFLRSVFLG